MAVEILDPAAGSFVLSSTTGPTTATYSPNTSAQYAGDGDVDDYALYDDISAVFGGSGFLDSGAGANQVILSDWYVTTENSNARLYMNGVVDAVVHGSKNANAGVYCEVRPGRIKIGGINSGAKAQAPSGLATGTQYYTRMTYDPAATTIQLEIFTVALDDTLWWDSGAVDVTGDDVAGGQPYFQAIDTTARGKGTALYDYTVSNVDYGQGGGIGVLAASGSFAYSSAAGLKGKGYLAGAEPITYSHAAILTGKGSLATSESFIYASLADLTAAIPSGAMIASASFGYTHAALLKGIGALVGPGSMAYSGLAALAGIGALIGSGASVYSGAGVLLGRGALSGTELFAYTSLAALTGHGALAGAEPFTYTHAAVLNGRGELIAVEPFTYTHSAILENGASGAMAASESFVYSGAGVLSGVGALAGAESAVYSSLAELIGRGELSGSESIIFSGVGDLAAVGAGAMAASELFAYTGAGTLSGTGALSAAAIMAYTSDVNLVGRLAVAGSGSYAFIPNANLTGIGALQASESIVYIPSAALSGTGALVASEVFVYAGSGVLVNVGKLVQCLLVDRTGVALPNLANLSWAWFDHVDPANFVAPSEQGAVEDTDGTGLIYIPIPGSGLSEGQDGTLVLRSNDGALIGAYNLTVEV